MYISIVRLCYNTTPSLPYPQPEIQIEVFDIHPVALCQIGLGGASYFEHTQTLEIPCEAMNTGSLAQNSKNVHQIDYDAFTDCVLAVLLSSWLNNQES